MTQEEKELLIKDLSARLPYGVKFACGKNVYTAKGLDLIVTDEGDWEYAVTAKGIVPIEIDFIKPHLRPMSSMTEDEKDELNSISHEFGFEWFDAKTIEERYTANAKMQSRSIDFYNKYHFDYRGLIPMGLAIEAPKDMYKND